MAPSSQGMEPPRNPGRFTGFHSRLTGCRLLSKDAHLVSPVTDAARSALSRDSLPFAATEVFMSISFRAQNRIAMAGMTAVAVAMIALLPSASTAPVKAAVAQGFYHQTNLVSDQPGVAPILDTNLVNPWGISMSPTGGAFWVANNVTSTATLYTGDVNGSAFVKNALVVSIPDGSPTGTVFNSSDDFVVSSGASSGRSFFLFASQTGTISGWNPAVPPPPSTLAQVGGTADAVYTGLAIGQVGT